MPIEHFGDGGTVVSGPEGMELYRLIALKSALKLEQQGIKVHRRVNARKLAKTETGLKTNNYDVLIGAVEMLIANQRAKVTHVYEASKPDFNDETAIGEPFKD